MEKKKTSFITTPIYYSSGNVHIGNSYTTICCDSLARFKRLKGNDTFYLTGMDEHGQKIQEAAAKLKITPQKLTDDIASKTQELWKRLNVSNDYFIRTTDKSHCLNVSEIFETLLKNDDIYLGSYEGDYCISCETFYSKTQVKDDFTCPDCGKKLTKVSEECYFLRMSKYASRLLEHIKNNPTFIEPESRKNEVVSFIESGLEDLSVSRTTFSWGIPVKSDPKHVVYVWIDALVNYISALNYNTDNDDLFNKYWINGDEIIHVLGKDILRFHAIIWPILLMCLNIPLKCKLYVHGWVLMKDGKMSKSAGNVIYPDEVIARYGLDPLRYFLLREMPLGNDATFTYERFLERYNSDLANDLGNLLKRTVSMINKYFDGVINKPVEITNEFSKNLIEVLENETKQVISYFDNFRFQNGLIALFNIISRANKYIDETTPWVLANQKEMTLLNEVMYVLYEVLRNASILISPIMPDTSVQITKDLNTSEVSFEDLKFGVTKTCKTAVEVKPLFVRYDIKKELESLSAPVAEIKNLKEEVTIDDFNKLDLRVGKVLNCTKLKGSDKLLVFNVLIETEERVIVSGISEYYQPDELIGKYVCVVANLKPVKIRGVVSNGMILSAQTNDNALEIVSFNKEKEFAKVK